MSYGLESVFFLALHILDWLASLFGHLLGFLLPFLGVREVLVTYLRHRLPLLA